MHSESDRPSAATPSPTSPTSPATNPPEPRWLAVVAVLTAGGLYFALPEPLTVGPHWLLLLILTILLVPALATNHIRWPRLNRVLGFAINGVITAFMIWSLALLIRDLLAHAEPPAVMLRSGALLWATNVLAFATWYWRLDAGGPHARARRLGHPTGAFQFPQMAMADHPARKADRPWSPTFLDYLFLAFNTSTALSPTDSPVLSRWAKALMMVQSLISLTVTLVLVARAVNIM